MRLMTVRLAAALLASCVSCSSIGRVSGATDSPFAGTWAQREAVLGTSLVLTLVVDGATVSGTGTYTIAGGGSGTLTEKGGISSDRLQLDITYDSGTLAQFDGELESPSVLSGSLHFGPRASLTPAAMMKFDKKAKR